MDGLLAHGALRREAAPKYGPVPDLGAQMFGQDVQTFADKVSR
jgi:hypothetical protein